MFPSCSRGLKQCGAWCAELCSFGRRPVPLGHGRFGEGVVNTTSSEFGNVLDRIDLGSTIPDDKILGELAYAIREQLRQSAELTSSKANDKDLEQGADKVLDDCGTVCLVVHRIGDEFHIEVGATKFVAANGVDGRLPSFDSASGRRIERGAEESALLKAVQRQGGGPLLEDVERVVLYNGSSEHIIPRHEAREVFARHLNLDVPVLCAWHEDGQPNLKIQHRMMRIYVVTVSQLFPHANIYRHVAQDKLPNIAQNIAGVCEPLDKFCKPLHELTLGVAHQLAELDQSHLVQYAAGVLFSSGEQCVFPNISEMQLESPGDPVGRLAGLLSTIKDHKSRDDPPQLVVIVDQWGTLHAPFAAGRSFFYDFAEDYQDLTFRMHSSYNTGKLLELKCADIIGVAANGPRQTTATVTKGGMKLGIEILKHPHSEYLTIEAIRDGRIKEWNEVNPSLEVIVGSKIISVNGETVSNKMIEIIKEADEFQLEFLTPF